MKKLVFPLLLLLSLSAFSQKIHDEFMPTIIGDKEAFLSSKTGEFVYRAHDKTDVSALYTTDSGIVIHEDRKTHAVKKGETLSAIAKKHGISVAELKSQNKLKSVNLSIGQELKVFKKEVVPSSKPVVNKPEGKIIARLAPGQTPGGMTPPDLPPDAMPGSTINLVVEDAKPSPAGRQAEPQAANVAENISEDGIVTHTVKGGETLFAIARKHKVSIDDLKKENKLALNTVRAGQKLKVKVYNPAVFSQSNTVATKPVVEEKPEPVELVETVTEEVNKVEKAVGQVKEVVVDEVVEEKKEKVIEVKKPTGVISSKAEKSSQDAKEEQTKALIEKYKKKDATDTSSTSSRVESRGDKSPSESKVYIVKKGDTLWSIAKKHQISLKDLKKLNNLSANTLSIGQKLKLK